jgi:hypothetical protein
MHRLKERYGITGDLQISFALYLKRLVYYEALPVVGRRSSPLQLGISEKLKQMGVSALHDEQQRSPHTHLVSSATRRRGC